MFIEAPQLTINGFRISRVKLVTMGIERTPSELAKGIGVERTIKSFINFKYV